MDPFQAGVNFLLGRLKQTAAAAWFRFLFEIAFSAVVSFLFTCGTVLVTSRSVALAIGSGMVMAALAMTVLFRREQSRLTKGMMAVLPGDEAGQELATSFQVINKPEKPEEKKP